MPPGYADRMSADLIAARARRANGIPLDADPMLALTAKRDDRMPWASRFVRNPWTWLTLGMTLVYLGCLWWMYALVTRDQEVDGGGSVPGINNAALREAFGYAWPTLAVWIVLFILIDRFRPQRPVLWYLALGWGAAVSTAASMVINTWAAERMGISGQNPASGARAAIYVAPFVEEATKATVLFLIALAVRYQLVSKLQAVALAGLSAAGFAFTENILYYSRAIVYSSITIETGDPDAAVQQLVQLRGGWLAFGHPLFTAMTAFGLVVALRARSKLVRIVAPLVGFLSAALMHMVFNSVASLMGDAQQKLMYFLIAVPLVLFVAVYLVRQVFAEGRRHRDRLGDYARMGWLTETDVAVFSKQRTRWRAVLNSITYGWRSFLATLALQRTITELVYLRDAQARGVIDAAGDVRARALLGRATSLRAVAVADPRVQKAQLPQLPALWGRLARRGPSPAYAAPGFPTGGVPVGAGAPPVGSPQYSPVDPGWGPPKG